VANAKPEGTQPSQIAGFGKDRTQKCSEMTLPPTPGFGGTGLRRDGQGPIRGGPNAMQRGQPATSSSRPELGVEGSRVGVKITNSPQKRASPPNA